MRYFVTGIDTDSGKTIFSAIACEALGADYWKPVQAGLPKDSETVQSLITNTKTKIHPETFWLKTPASPHAAARIDGVTIQLTDFKLPRTDNHLVIEGAGGCLVPLNDADFVVDLIKKLDAEVILVADLYLGSINHTLLTVEALQKRQLKIIGIVFNGESNQQSESIILHHTRLRRLLSIAKHSSIDRATVRSYAELLKKELK